MAKKLTVIEPIRNDKQHAWALKVIEQLWDAKPGSKELRTLEVLAILVEDYERKAFPLDDPDPVEAVKFRLEQLGLERKDLVPIIGSRSRVSEFLSGKRRLSLEMVRRLYDELHIPMEALIPRHA